MDLDTRKLATIRKISAVEAIEGADNIEKVLIDGWQCVCKKGEFKPGDLCVYFEIDSFLPIRPEFEFLRKSSYRKMGDKEGFRLRTIKLRKTLSQGLAMPLRGLILDADFNYLYLKEEIDVTDHLGVALFEPPIHPSLQGKVTNWPSFLRKTNQKRVQNIWHKIKDLNETFEVTEKMDGMSCTYYLNDGKFGVCSREWEIVDTPGNTLWEIARRYDIEQSLRSLDKTERAENGRPCNFALQGEIVGEGIQKNPHNIKGQDFYLFDIWNIDEQLYLPPGERCLIGSFLCGLKLVPEITYSKSLRGFAGDINNILSFSDGDYLREGVVFKSRSSSLTFKVISNNYLLAQKE
jgi:RNA ligase (TIGR02306 family)